MRYDGLCGAGVFAVVWMAMSGALAARGDVTIPVNVPDQVGRRLILHLPANAGPGPIPLLLGFHGGGGSAESFRSITGLNATADARGFAVAYMDAGDGVWGDYRPGPGNPAGDLAYVRAALDLLIGEYGVDPRRVYATGLSNGAAFSMVLASELSDRIAAIAPVAHNLTQSFVDQATPSGPIHILQIVGTADPLMPFTGGVQGPGDVVLSSLETMLYWQAINGSGASSASQLPNLAADGTTAVRETYAASVAGFELGRIVVVNGGHTWPGGLQYLPESVIGLTSRDFVANDVMWDFFVTKALPSSTPGACCRGVVCTLAFEIACSGGLGNVAPVFRGPGVACNAPSNAVMPCCRADFNQDGSLAPSDIFSYLGAYFGSSAGVRALADTSGEGALSPTDIFSYLTLYFAGCS